MYGKSLNKKSLIGVIVCIIIIIAWVDHKYIELIDAISVNNNEKVEKLLKLPYFSLDWPSGHIPWRWFVGSETSLTPLEQACKSDNYTAAKMLIEKGADAGWINYGHFSLLYLTMEYTDADDYEMVKLLVENGADPNGAPDEENDGESSLSICARMYCGDYDYKVRGEEADNVVTEQNYQIEQYNNDRAVGAHYDLNKAKTVVSIYRYLEKRIEKENDPIKKQYGVTPLHIAVGSQNLELIKYLLDEGKYSVNDKDNEGQICVFSLLPVDDPKKYDKKWMKDTFDLLIQYGADPIIKDKEGKTVYDYAIEQGDDYLAGLLKPYMKNADKSQKVTD